MRAVSFDTMGDSDARPKVAIDIRLDEELPPYELLDTPSRKAGLSLELEEKIRIWGCELIQVAGILLKRPQVVMACAQMLFQRFYYRESFSKWPAQVCI